MLDNGIATIRPDYDHSVPVWERILGLGFAGLLQESELARKEQESLTAEQAAFFDGIQITYTGILDFIARLEKQARKDGNVRMMPVATPANSTADRLVEQVPDVLDRISAFIDSRMEKKGE